MLSLKITVLAMGLLFLSATFANDLENGYYGIKANINKKFVSAESDAGSPLIAKSTSAGNSETFYLFHNAYGNISLQSIVNEKYVTVGPNGSSALIAGAKGMGPSEQYYLIKNTDGSYSLKAAKNNKYVVAENKGNSPLIANRSAIGAWEKFTFVKLNSERKYFGTNDEDENHFTVYPDKDVYISSSNYEGFDRWWVGTEGGFIFTGRDLPLRQSDFDNLGSYNLSLVQKVNGNDIWYYATADFANNNWVDFPQGSSIILGSNETVVVRPPTGGNVTYWWVGDDINGYRVNSDNLVLNANELVQRGQTLFQLTTVVNGQNVYYEKQIVIQ